MPDTLCIGFLSQHNPFDRSAFSGTAFHMHRALAAAGGLDVRVLGGHRPPRLLDRLSRRRKARRPFEVAADEFGGLDAIVALTATQAAHRALARTDVPLVHVTDATPAFLRDFYGRDIAPETERLEAEVVHGAALVVYSSDYMADRAAAEFGAARDRLAAVPFGMNFDAMPSDIPAKPPLARLRLLWVGSNWARKGGQIALESYSALRDAGVDAELALVGNVPKDLPLPPGAERVGFLDKSRPEEAARLVRLFSEAHVFLLPTRADCTPMVVAEANAHGTPVLITGTGGIGSLMDPAGANGRMLPMEAGPADWAAAIRDLTDDPAAHAALCRSSFEHARTRLTWTAWARDVAELLDRIVRA